MAKKVQKRTPKRKSSLWKVYHAPPAKGNPPKMRNGEPRIVELVLWEGDRAFHGEEKISCCDCGLDHFNSYEIFVEHDTSRLVLQVRAYRLGKKGKLD